MFGAPAGISAEAGMESQLAAAQMQRVQAGVTAAEAPARMMEMMAQGRLVGAEAGLKESELSMQRAFAANAQALAGKSGQPTDMAGQIDQMAQIAMKSGQVQKAADLADKAAMLRYRGTEAQRMQALMKNERLAVSAKQFDVLGQVYQGATDQASFDQATALLKMQGIDSPWAGSAYSPELVSQIKNQALTVQAKMLRDTQQTREEAMQQREMEIERHHTATEQLMAENERIRLAQAERAAKAGQVVGTPSANEVKQVTATLQEQFPELDADKLPVWSSDVAGRAKAIMKQNPGVDWETAQNQAITEMGIHKEVQKDSFLRIPYDKTTVVKDGGQPLALPASQDDLKIGPVYKTSRGAAKWNGTAFWANSAEDQ